METKTLKFDKIQFGCFIEGILQVVERYDCADLAQLCTKSVLRVLLVKWAKAILGNKEKYKIKLNLYESTAVIWALQKYDLTDLDPYVFTVYSMVLNELSNGVKIAICQKQDEAN